jgi:hypothetical protein
MSDNLIICPVGIPLNFDDRFDKDNHWRYTKENRLYKTIAFQYSDFSPPKNTYDELVQMTGFKWSIAKEWLKTIDYTQYEYIGFMDDDVVTDIQTMNRAITIAREKQFKIFQLSMTDDSDCFWKILKNKPQVKYAVTNFVEVMGPFIHSSLIPICMELWDEYDIYTGWGFDKVICELTKTDAAVIHDCQMYHPKRTSTYQRHRGFSEMDFLTNHVMPRFMKKKYNEDWSFVERYIEKEILLEIK